MAIRVGSLAGTSKDMLGTVKQALGPSRGSELGIRSGGHVVAFGGTRRKDRRKRTRQKRPSDGKTRGGGMRVPLLATGRRVGPAAAARAALAAAGVAATADHASWRAADGAELQRPLDAPWGVRRRFLLASWRRTEWDRLARRRADFAAAGVPDLAAAWQRGGGYGPA